MGKGHCKGFFFLQKLNCKIMIEIIIINNKCKNDKREKNTIKLKCKSHDYEQ